MSNQIYWWMLMAVAGTTTTMTLANPVPVTTTTKLTANNINQQQGQHFSNTKNILIKDEKLVNFQDKRNDVITTIQQVQNLLNNDPNLPRLTKGEIEELFEQVTKEEYEKSLLSGDINRANHMRALMLVLPYNTVDNNSEQDLQELFNRPPITKVIPTPNERKPPKPQQTVVVPIVNTNPDNFEILSINNMVKMQPTTYKPTFRRRKITSKLPPPPPPITTYHPLPSTSDQSEFELLTTPIKEEQHNNHKYEIITIKHNQPITQFVTTIDQPDELIEINQKMTTTTTEKPQTRFSSHYNAENLNFKLNTKLNNNNPTTTKLTVTAVNTTPKSLNIQENDELDDVLSSLGLTSKIQTRRRIKFADYVDFELPKPIMSSLIKQERVTADEFQPISMKINDFHKSLIPASSPALPQSRSDDFIAFKPLNINGNGESNQPIDSELEDYLIKFGLVGTRTRSGKSSAIHSQPQPPPLIEKTIVVPTTTTTLKPRINVEKRIDTNIDDNSFNLDLNDSHDYEELMKLLNNLRELQELKINLTSENLDKLQLNYYNFSTNLLPNNSKNNNNNIGQGLDPLQIPEFIDLQQQKNEVKRQEPIRFNFDNLNIENSNDLPQNTSKSTEFSSLTDEIIPPSTTSATATTTVESANGAISDLEDSFGKLDPVTEEPLPPPRKNGFYFLADINSFLEVGDGDEKVLVRFNPKIGDPSRFISVKVP